MSNYEIFLTINHSSFVITTLWVAHQVKGNRKLDIFCEGFEEILHYGMMRCRSSLCVCVLAWHLLLGTPRASKFGKCEPWYIAWRLFSKKIQKSQNGIFGEFFYLFP